MDNHGLPMLEYPDRVIEEALRTSPLAPAPPLLYAAVMRQVRQSAAYTRPVFRVSWLDLALSLFAAGMLGLGWVTWLWLPSAWLGYLRLQALWVWQKAWYLDGSWLILGGMGAAALAAALAGAILALWKDGAWQGPWVR